MAILKTGDRFPVFSTNVAPQGPDKVLPGPSVVSYRRWPVPLNNPPLVGLAEVSRFRLAEKACGVSEENLVRPESLAVGGPLKKVAGDLVAGSHFFAHRCFH